VFNNIRSFFNHPFPEPTGFKATLQSSFGAGLVVFLVLILFQPFSIDSIGSKLYLFAGVYGIITFVTALLWDVVLVYLLKIQKDIPAWTFKNWLLSVFCMILMIALANSVFTSFLQKQTLDLGILYNGVVSTMTVAIIPTFLFGAINIINNLRKNEKIASEISATEPNLESASESIQLKSDGQSETLSFNSNEFLFAEAQQNYILLVFFKQNTIHKEMIRYTMKRLEEELAAFNIVRCHRSYLVNKNKIENITGNAQGLKLFLSNYPETFIPVSRSFISKFRS